MFSTMAQALMSNAGEQQEQHGRTCKHNEIALLGALLRRGGCETALHCSQGWKRAGWRSGNKKQCHNIRDPARAQTLATLILLAVDALVEKRMVPRQSDTNANSQPFPLSEYE